MKKLKKMLSQTQVLTRSQLKNVLGGTTDGLAVSISGMDCGTCNPEDWCCDITGRCITRIQPCP
ncbi:hypothetical protein ACJVDH_11470 [Pedobacter sp. AW1-32]|uniref:hypothetical protein n=1 Tax=Pedobacter sp. AW1-32 TaxID=3383026 RepID=UPI003FEEE860